MSRTKHRWWPGAILALLLLVGVCAPAAADGGVTGPAPDLVIEALSWAPQSPLIGDTVTFTVTIRNRGDASSGSSRIKCYIDEHKEFSDIVDPMDAGATITRTFDWVAWAGAHTIVAVADADGDIAETNEDNNSTAFALSVLAPDLIVESVTWLPEDPSEAEQVDFTIAVRNQGNSSARFSQVKIYVDGNYRGYNEVPKLEAGENFTFTFNYKVRAGSQYVEIFADALEHVVESNEDNNVKEVLCSTAAPDLIISSVSWTPESPSENTTATVNLTIHNQGLGTAGTSYLVYYIDEMSQYSVCIGQIEAGENTSTSFIWPVISGYHEVRAVADINDRVIESDEANNSLTVPLPSPSPDLVVQSITWSPSSPIYKRQVEFSVVIKNQGKSASSQCYLYLYIQGYNPWKILVPEIGASATYTLTLPWTVKKTKCTIEAVADAEEVVAECNEENNSKTVNFTATKSIEYSDLVIKSITWSPESPAIGDKVTFTVCVGNDGDAASTPSHVAYYLDDVWQDTDYIGEIASGANVTATFEMAVGGGTYTLRAVADTNEAVEEEDEENNDKTVTFTVPAPDVVIKGITWSPLRPEAGDRVDFTVTVENRGTLSAVSCGIDYYVDGASRGSHNMEELAAGETATTVFTWTAQDGSHVIDVVADLQDRIVESDEENNRREVAFPTPDLVIQDVTWSPQVPSENETVTFTVTTANHGAGGAGGNGICFYVDDVAVGSEIIGDIAAGATGTAVFTWMAKEGSHIIRIAADGEDVVTELDELNNEELFDLSVLLLPASSVVNEGEGTVPVDAGEAEEGVPAGEDAAMPGGITAGVVEDDETPLQKAIAKWWPIIAAVVLGSFVISALILLRGRLNISWSFGKSSSSNTGDSPPPQQAPEAPPAPPAPPAS